jgi:Sulfotransferase domain
MDVRTKLVLWGTGCAGKTLEQMILYQLLTDGDMSIAHLNRFAPYLDDVLRGCARPPRRPGQEAAGPRWRRRVMKAHAGYRLMPKGCGRYVYVVRDGRDAAISYYYHHKRNGYPKGFSEFMDQYLEGKLRFGRWIDHVREWTRNRDGLNILFLRFEDLLADLRTSVLKIAEFCEIPVVEAEMPRILHRCSFEFMRENEDKLDVRTRLMGSERSIIPAASPANSVRLVTSRIRKSWPTYHLAVRGEMPICAAISEFRSPLQTRWSTSLCRAFRRPSGSVDCGAGTAIPTSDHRGERPYRYSVGTQRTYPLPASCKTRQLL